MGGKSGKLGIRGKRPGSLEPGKGGKKPPVKGGISGINVEGGGGDGDGGGGDGNGDGGGGGGDGGGSTNVGPSKGNGISGNGISAGGNSKGNGNSSDSSPWLIFENEPSTRTKSCISRIFTEIITAIVVN